MRDYHNKESSIEFLITNIEISFKGFGCLSKGKILWQVAALSLIWFIWLERNARIFKGRWRSVNVIWDLIFFFSSIWASNTKTFVDIPLYLLVLTTQ